MITYKQKKREIKKSGSLSVVVVVIQESEENSNSIVQAVGDFIGVPFAESEISVSRRVACE